MCAVSSARFGIAASLYVPAPVMRMMLPQGAGIVSVVKLDPSVSLAKIEDPSCCDDVFESSSLVYIDPDLFAISMHEVMQWDFS